MALKIKNQGASPETDVAATFKELSKTATSLNLATDRLNSAVQQVNEALKELNLGVSSWTTFDVDEDGPFLSKEQIGYDKLNGRWSILLRSIFEDRGAPSDQPEDVSTWFFTEAPRHMRLKGIGHLHKLLAQLNEDAENTARNIIMKSVEAEQFAKAIYRLADEESEKKMPPTEDK
ncbi:MAG TPA: hypothetical protein VFB04_14465 [Terriglobales bacterium]|nr:hypothetical protein [Terriglobales bacterium]